MKVPIQTCVKLGHFGILESHYGPPSQVGGDNCLQPIGCESAHRGGDVFRERLMVDQ